MLKFLLKIFHGILKVRYKVRFEGTEVFAKPGAKLFLPNHQAQIDSQILGSFLFKHVDLTPIIAERFFENGILRALFNAMDAIPASDLTRGSRDTETLDKIFKGTMDALASGRSILLYPSGRHTGQGLERIMNKKSAWFVTSNLPDDVTVVGVRISGLWGSMWSNVYTGKSSRLFKNYFKGIGIVLANFIFFVPKRDVLYEFVDITEEAKRISKQGLKPFNDYLESYYNERGEEKVRFIKHFWFTGQPNRKVPAKIENSYEDWLASRTLEANEIPVEISNGVIAIIAKEADIPVDQININSNLHLDLAIDSISLVQIIADVEEKFQPKTPIEVPELKSVGDICLCVMGKEIVEEELKPSYLHETKLPVTRLVLQPGKSIPNLFLSKFNEDKAEPFAYDKMVGFNNRKDFLLKAFVLSKIIKKEFKDKHVGVMLPAMQSTTMLVAAIYLAEKIPVMLNWTVGKKVMDHCINITGLNYIITAEKFYLRVEDLLSENSKKMCVFLERKVKAAGLGIKLGGLFASKFVKKVNTDPDSVAVILFTSGSESMPKAVPLTHNNLTTNIHNTFAHCHHDSDMFILSFLPPFHSFGFTLCTIHPMVTGVRMAYTPDPTDTKEILKILGHTKANSVFATPTFLRMILNAVKGEELRNVKLAILGAESSQESTIKEFYSKASPKANLLEGYGITECSPILSYNPIEKKKTNSVGTFIPEVESLIVNVETYEPVKQGEEGMILVNGPNVFGGYLNPDIASPFVEVHGKQYYKTGDLGYQDEEGYLYITGRLKRFIKIAGEMISLQAIERTLLDKYGTEEEMVLAIDGRDDVDPPQITLFSIFEIDVREANAYLREQGFSSLIKVNKCIPIEKIPLLGTGKTDYKQLKELAV